MIIFAFFIFITIKIFLILIFLTSLSPVLVGLFIIIVINGVSKGTRGRFAPALWNVATVGVMIFCTWLLCKDIFHDHYDFGPLPFLILMIYGFGSLAAFAIPAAINQRKEQKARRAQWQAEVPAKRPTAISRTIAIVCSGLTGVGILILITESAPLAETLPPTIVFGFASIVCWIIPRQTGI